MHSSGFDPRTDLPLLHLQRVQCEAGIAEGRVPRCAGLHLTRAVSVLAIRSHTQHLKHRAHNHSVVLARRCDPWQVVDNGTVNLPNSTGKREGYTGRSHRARVGALLAELRSLTGLSLRQFGGELHLSAGFISRLEKGHNGASADTLALYEHRFGLQPGCLVAFKEMTGTEPAEGAFARILDRDVTPAAARDALNPDMQQWLRSARDLRQLHALGVETMDLQVEVSISPQGHCQQWTAQWKMHFESPRPRNASFLCFAADRRLVERLHPSSSPCQIDEVQPANRVRCAIVLDPPIATRDQEGSAQLAARPSPMIDRVLIVPDVGQRIRTAEFHILWPSAFEIDAFINVYATNQPFGYQQESVGPRSGESVLSVIADAGLEPTFLLIATSDIQPIRFSDIGAGRVIGLQWQVLRRMNP
jgi:transcriptional regulator with XRE-family HTH domain